MSIAIEKLFSRPNGSCRRPETDRFFLTPLHGASESLPFETARFVQEKQLKNETLWTLFTRQFIVRPDFPDHGWRGEYWGKMMRAACFTYRVTEDAELYAVMEKTVRDMMATADSDGRISTYPAGQDYYGWDLWSRKYILLGFEYFYEICPDDALKARLMEAMKAHLDVILRDIGEGEGRKNILDTSEWWGAINSCSILEPVVRLYNLTGEKRYFDFASYIVSTGGSNLGSVLALAQENKLAPWQYPVVKAYETMSFFEGIAEYYRVTGDESLKAAVVNFADAVLATDYTIIGNCGCTHELFDNSTLRQTEWQNQIMQETCVSVTLSKFLLQVFCLTGDPKYMDAMEKTWYNSILGSVNFAGNTLLAPDPIPGSPFSYTATADFTRSIGGYMFDSYSPLYKGHRNRGVGGYKEMENSTAYGCCACIGGAGTALLPLTALMLAEDGIAVNHYLTGTFSTAAPDGSALTIKMTTGYPYDGTVTLDLAGEDTEYTLYLRVPAYSDGKLTVDGKAECAKAGTYCAIRLSGAAHRVVMELSIAARTTCLNGKVAVEKGCIVYAVDSRAADINTAVTEKITGETPCEAPFKARSAVCFTFSDGTELPMVDYASADADWDDPSIWMTAWLDTAESK